MHNLDNSSDFLEAKTTRTKAPIHNIIFSVILKNSINPGKVTNHSIKLKTHPNTPEIQNYRQKNMNFEFSFSDKNQETPKTKSISNHPTTHFSKFNYTHTLVLNFKQRPKPRNEKRRGVPWEQKTKRMNSKRLKLQFQSSVFEQLFFSKAGTMGRGNCRCGRRKEWDERVWIVVRSDSWARRREERLYGRTVTQKKKRSSCCLNYPLKKKKFIYSLMLFIITSLFRSESPYVSILVKSELEPCYYGKFIIRFSPLSIF